MSFQLKKWIDEEIERREPLLIKSLVSEFWNARESWQYASKHGNTKDIEKAGRRAHEAQWELEVLGFFKNRTKMPTLDELEKETCQK